MIIECERDHTLKPARPVMSTLKPPRSVSRDPGLVRPGRALPARYDGRLTARMPVARDAPHLENRVIGMS
jgi:hypothetical protein